MYLVGVGVYLCNDASPVTDGHAVMCTHAFSRVDGLTSGPCLNSQQQLSELAGRMNAKYGEGTVIYEERDAKDATLAQRYLRYYHLLCCVCAR